MNRGRDVEGLLDLWLEEGPEEVPDVVVEQALVTIDSTNQVRAPFGRSWRGITMPKFAPVAIGTAVVLLVAVLGVGFLGGGNNTAPGNPLASPSPSASAHAGAASPSVAVTPSAVASAAATSSAGAGPVDTTGWTAYTSERYGFDLAYPRGFTARPSTRDWTMEPDRVNDLTSAAEGFLAPDYSVYLSAFAAKIAPGTSTDAWQTAYQQPIDGCDINRKEQAIVDGHPATISHTCQESHAFVFIGDRAYVFAVWKPDQEALLRAFLSTVRFHAGNGVTPRASPS
jgi:hypothetical protein